jgi:valyl-tRNA synthetase
MSEPLATRYDPGAIEDATYAFWTGNGFFRADESSDRPPYTIVIPPPNVTGALTLGHVLNNTLQDILIRHYRMRGREALWMPGTDHAGIATQNRVEKALAAEGTSRHDLGRDAFVERVWAWKKEYGDTIVKQLKKLGCSCDWERERFTMDAGLSAAVEEIFVRLYEDGLIYKGKYIVNWCPRCHTAISDEEKIVTDRQGHLWHIRYPGADGGDGVVVATTRPETLLGDTAVAVNPEDARYTGAAGTTVVLPVLERRIPIVADAFVDPAFGTGAVKVTPAHDPNDFEIGNRHDLPRVNVMHENGTMNENAGPYAGLDRDECRRRLVADLEARGLLVKIEDYTVPIGACQRCDTVVEPYLSDQWFVKMKPLAEPALRAVRDGTLSFTPARWVKTYEHWLENIRDWCISRQLWWGHRIPAWTCDDCGAIAVVRGTPAACPACGGSRLTRDPDVLDTWFSSWLWPFSTMDWPRENPTLAKFYPTDALVTAADIIFFWVARMVMAGYRFTGKCPFREVYFNGLVRDEKGRKMSKSLGNSPDPLDMIAQYGADALRFTVTWLTPEGQDILFSTEKVEIGRNFMNKLWNASRFVLMNLEGAAGAPPAKAPAPAAFEDRWILSRLADAAAACTEAVERYGFNEGLRALYNFFWHDYCDWYVEIVKDRLKAGGDATQSCRAVLAFCLDRLLRLLHPFVPFGTEAVWQKLYGEAAQAAPLIAARWPDGDAGARDPEAEREMALLQGVVRAVRNVRNKNGVARAAPLAVAVKADAAALAILDRHEAFLKRMAHIGALTRGPDLAKPASAVVEVVEAAEVFVVLDAGGNVEAQRKRLGKDLEKTRAAEASCRGRLENETFLSRAKPEVVAREKARHEELLAKIATLEKTLADM